eukprot:3972058-Amphidinium_carterae.1
MTVLTGKSFIFCVFLSLKVTELLQEAEIKRQQSVAELQDAETKRQQSVAELLEEESRKQQKLREAEEMRIHLAGIGSKGVEKAAPPPKVSINQRPVGSPYF